MKITCKQHGTDILGNRCPQCYQANVDAFNERFKGMNVTHGGIRGHERTVLIDGAEVPWGHDEEGVGYDWVPSELADQINSYIEQAVKKYLETCQCATCQIRRNEGAT
jgi:hypothetical protein